jgi:hypothetical protein
MGIIYRPDDHVCHPGWSRVTDWLPPSSHDYPPGTVWQCDECGLRWVSVGFTAPRGFAAGYLAGCVEFKPEGWLARRRREKAQARRAAVEVAPAFQPEPPETPPLFHVVVPIEQCAGDGCRCFE